MWPSSPAPPRDAPVEPAVEDRARRAIPVPRVSTIASEAPRAAPARCSARADVVAVVVNEHGQSEPFGHHVGEGDVGQRSVHADPHLAGAAVDQRRQSEADGVDLGPRRLTGFGDRVDRHVEQGALLQTRYGPLNAVVNA